MKKRKEEDVDEILVSMIHYHQTPDDNLNGAPSPSPTPTTNKLLQA